MRSHHPEGLLDTEMQRPAHAPSDVPAAGAQAAGQRTTSLRLTLLYSLAGLKRCGAQLQQLLLGGVAGGLQHLSPLSRVPQRGAQA
jgi:hypothetical protein